MPDFSFLFELEKQLHSFEVRSSASKLSSLLSPNFFEHGSSGKIWTRNDILERLPTEDGAIKIQSRDYKAIPLAADVVLITYISVSQEGDVICGECLRSSLWRKNPNGWQMEFHQGTRKQ
ncbi:MAG: RNAse [Pedosphaera sp.]|nr:RNAse [Pedosphaera sp.]